MASSLMGPTQNLRNMKKKGKAKFLEDDEDYRPEEEGPTSSGEEEEDTEVYYDDDDDDNFSGGSLQASILAQDWLGPSNRHSGSGPENVQDAVSESGRKIDSNDYRIREKEGDASRRNGNEEAYDHCEGEHWMNGEDLLHSLDITEEYALDGEVGRRLNQMVPVPHIPKTNEKMPTVDEEISDHHRLIERLQLYDLVECKIRGDGNCQFRALSDQLYRSSEYHSLEK